MAWRIVRQPNGKWARFSDVVDDFTHYDMCKREALNLCLCLGVQDPELKVQGAVKNPGRFDDEIETIELVHGKEKAMLRRCELSISDEDRKRRADQERRERVQKMRELSKSMREPDDFVCRFIYCGDDGKRMMRTVSPIRFEGDRMLGLCLSSESPRWFVLDRVEKIIAAMVPASSVLMPVEMIEVEG